MDQFSNHPLYGRHNIESVMSSLWQFYKKKFIVLFIISFLVSLLMQYLSLTFNFNELQTITDPQEMIEKFKGLMWPMIGILMINLFFTTVLHYYVIYNPVDSSTTIFNSFYRSLKYVIPYIILIVLFIFLASAAMVLGLLALIIGVFFTMLYVFTLGLFLLPVLMVEGPIIGNAISRSFTLTHRNFWSNLGWVAVFILLVLIISVILSSFVMLPFTGKFLKILTNPGETVNALDFMSNPVYLTLLSIVKALTFPLMPIFASILYFNGKAGEEYNSVAPSGKEDQKVRVEDLYSKPGEDNQPEN
ncbi:MAG: hypothetical protein MUC93_04595 [Bacteroidales bacterium]|jgi:hypothetical protein|nr:hypothetical protein [Bacteroidales bacterium]